MYRHSPTAENVSLSLTFLGKKIRNVSVAPAMEQRAWETPALPSDSDISMETVRGTGCPDNSSAFLEELPGSVPDLREEVPQRQPFPVHNTHLDKDPDQDARPGRAARKDCEEEGSDPVKIFIPYDSAKLCITQMAEDMQLMRGRHTEILQELEHNFLMASKQNQEIAQKIRTHYQSKLSTLKTTLNAYQDRAERKDVYLEQRLKSLKAQNRDLTEQLTAHQDRATTNAAHWEREKKNMLELFSSRLDLLQSHQASTLRELQATRLELGKVQGMLKPVEAEEQRPLLENRGTAQEDDTAGDTESSGCERGAQTPWGGTLPLEGAQARLECLKESLFKREREITQLLQDGGEPACASVTKLTCSALLNAVIRTAHCIYAEVAEAKRLVDSMAEGNHLVLSRACKPLQPQPSTTEHRSTGDSTLSAERSEIAEPIPERAEIIRTALECIRTGGRPGSHGALEIRHSCTEPGPESDLNYQQGSEGAEHSENLTARKVKSVGQQLLQLQAELQQLREENKRIIENYNSERVMRKKYYNMVEDMKGKIRVFCRIRPMNRTEAAAGSKTVVDCVDEFSVAVGTPRGLKEFQFDRVFGPDSSQEEVFQDTSRLIQSAIDGFNVCIFAYGQTGSGKTFTMVGDKNLKSPGIMPRAFRKIFDLIEENSSKFEFKVSAYMLELYNDRLLDLLVSPAEGFCRKIEVKKDRKGVVFAQGAETVTASSTEELSALFEQGCANRHIAATQMNVESSRSHLIIGIIIESTNLTNGSVTYGKLSLVDLAGSERAAKTGAKDDQLKEANSINKSLSALGDVIFALSSDQQHIPYRNNKLTQAMQDSLGGNAKTLMFVNVSPSDCSSEETLTSLSYATRVKAITNNAQKILESKEIAHLKEIILKLRSGQPLEEDV